MRVLLASLIFGFVANAEIASLANRLGASTVEEGRALEVMDIQRRLSELVGSDDAQSVIGDDTMSGDMGKSGDLSIRRMHVSDHDHGAILIAFGLFEVRSLIKSLGHNLYPKLLSVLLRFRESGGNVVDAKYIIFLPMIPRLRSSRENRRPAIVRRAIADLVAMLYD